MSICPSQAELESLLLDDELVEHDRHQLEEHLTACQECTARFEAIMEDTQSNWQDWQSLLESAEPCESRPSKNHVLSNERLLEHFRQRGFENVTEIGTGGMGIVFKAYQPALHRHVAIKMLIGGAVDRP